MRYGTWGKGENRKRRNDLKAGGIKPRGKVYLLSKLTFISKFTLGS